MKRSAFPRQRWALSGVLVSIVWLCVSAASAQVPNIEGTYKLMGRRLPDGTTQPSPAIVGLITYTKHYRSFQLIWTEPDGKIYSLSSGATYELSPTQYTETLLFFTETDQISGKGTSSNRERVSRSTSVTMKEGRIEFKLPFDPPTLVFEGNRITATAQSGIFARGVPAAEGRVDVWEKVD